VTLSQHDALLDRLADRLGTHRFRPTSFGEEGQRVFQRQEFAITKFSMLDTFVVMSAYDEALEAKVVARFSADAMTLARAHRHFMPLGFGGALVTYPLMIVPRVPEELSRFLAGHAPAHWSAFEFPVVLDASTGSLHHYTGTPMWGMAYYAGFRSEVAQLFGAA
jgi:hypothetical protein